MDKDKPAGLPPLSPPQQSPSTINDLSQMPENPRKNTGHRRAHSEILTLPDDITFDDNLGIINCDNGVGNDDVPSLSDDTEGDDLFSMYIDMDKVNSATSSGFQLGEGSSGNAPVRGRHQHSQSMDGSSSIKAEMFTGGGGGDGGSSIEAKKAMSAAKLAELALIDPKRAKRIWANRQSAARSKERKMRYIAELERKVQTLQTEATTLTSQLSLLQRDTNGLNGENSELKIRLQTMEQQVHLQDALNDALKEEIRHLKMLTGQTTSNGGGGPMMNFPSSFGPNQPFFPNNNQAMHTLLTAQQKQFQQLQIHSQKQQQHQFQLHQLHPHQHQQQLQHQDPSHPSPIPTDYKMRPFLPTSKENNADNKSKD